MRASKIVFVVPAYNEGANIRELLECTREAALCEGSGAYKIVVVDDGSVDETPQILRESLGEFPLEIVCHSRNMGVGRAFMDGFKRALEICEDDDVIVTMEADNTSDLKILPQLVRATRNGSDLALASCYAKEGRVEGANWYRRLLSATANTMLRLVCPIPGVQTYSSFYRVWRPAILRRLMEYYGDHLIEEKGFACMLELLLKLRRFNPRIVEVPMVLRCQLRKGQSKMKTLRTMMAYLRLMATCSRRER